MPRKTTTRRAPPPPEIDYEQYIPKFSYNQRKLFAKLNGKEHSLDDSSSAPLAKLVAKYPGGDIYKNLIRDLGMVVQYDPRHSGDEYKDLDESEYVDNSIQDYNEVYTRRPNDELTTTNSTDKELLAQLPYVPMYRTRRELEDQVANYIQEQAGFFPSTTPGGFNFSFIDENKVVSDYTYRGFNEDLRPGGIFRTLEGKRRLTPGQIKSLELIYARNYWPIEIIQKNVTLSPPLPAEYKLVEFESINPAMNVLPSDLSNLMLGYLAPEKITTKQVSGFYQVNSEVFLTHDPERLYLVDFKTGLILYSVPNPFSMLGLRYLSTPYGLVFEGVISGKIECRVYSEELEFLRTLYIRGQYGIIPLAPFDLDEFLLRADGGVLPYPSFMHGLEETYFEPNSRQIIMDFIAAHPLKFIDVTKLEDTGGGLQEVKSSEGRIFVEVDGYFANQTRILLVADRTALGIEAILKFLMMFTFNQTPITAPPPVMQPLPPINVDMMTADTKQAGTEARHRNEFHTFKYQQLINPPHAYDTQQELATKALRYYIDFVSMQQLESEPRLAVGIGGQVLIGMGKSPGEVVLVDAYVGIVGTIDVKFNVGEIVPIRSPTTVATYAVISPINSADKYVYDLNTGKLVKQLPIRKMVPLNDTLIALWNKQTVEVYDIVTNQTMGSDVDEWDKITDVFPTETGFAGITFLGQLRLYAR